MMSKLRRIYTYVRQGHSIYLAFPMSTLNFMVIIYTLFLTNIAVVHAIFPSILIFMLVFSVLYFPFTALVGRKDFHHGQFITDRLIALQNDPFTQSTVQYFLYMAQGEPLKAVQVMEKWLSAGSYEEMKN